MSMLTLRYDLRLPDFSTTTRAAQYATCLDQVAWGEEHGFSTTVLSEHHGVDDGYLSAPLMLAGVIAGRTRAMAINISALLVPLHDPIRLAEDLAVLDLASGGRLSVIAGIGYRDGEFEMFGVERKGRGVRMEEQLRVMKQAWTGEPFEYRGTTVRVTPKPLTEPHPIVLVGGSTEVAARRAARLELGFMPAINDPELERIYREECEAVGFAGGFTILPRGATFTHVTDDPERDWARLEHHILYDVQTYSGWQTPGQRSHVTFSADSSLEELKRSGIFAVVTPDECAELARRQGGLVFHPLMGGMPPEMGWESLELFASKVLPQLQGGQ